MSRLTIIVAATVTNGIGKQGGLPWKLPKEMAYFARATTHVPSSSPTSNPNAVIMGRNTWESIPLKFRPLKNRTNVVVTRQSHYDAKNAQVVGSLEEAIQKVQEATTRAFLIGGASLYEEALGLPRSSHIGFVDRVLLTRVLRPDFPDCDVYMPDFLAAEGDGWTRETHQALEEWLGFAVSEGVQEEDGVDYEFQMWTRAQAK